MVNLTTYIEESLYNHIIIDNSSPYHVNEKYGESNNVKPIVDIICDDILNDNVKHVYTYKNIFFNKLYINTKDSKICKAWYDQSKTDYTNKIIYINLLYPINNPFDYINTISSLIIHELTHANEDLNFKIVASDEYTKSIGNIFNLNVNKCHKEISKFIYMLDDHERNAYLSQLTSDIKHIIKTHNWNTKTVNYKVLIKELKESNTIWKIYFGFESLINEINHNTNSFYIKSYNSITNKSLTNKQIVKELTVKFNKFKNKFEVNVPRILFDNLPVYEGLCPSIDINLFN